MPIEQPEATTATTRRAFLARSAAGGALVAAVAATGAAGGLGGVLPVGAQAGGSAGELDNDGFATLTTPLEMAAVQAYQAATEGPALDDTWKATARTFQAHHQEVATLLATLIEAKVPPVAPPVPDAAVAARFTAPAGADQTAVLTLLASLEEALAATHLAAIGSLADSSTAKTVAQVLAIESQQAVALGRAAGATIESLTPAKAPTTGTLTGSGGTTSSSTSSSTTSTTAATTTAAN